MKKHHVLKHVIQTVMLSAALLLAAVPVHADGGRQEDSSSKTLLQSLQNTYWQWYYGSLTLPMDANGNAVINGIAFLRFPNAPGDGTPGSIDLTISAKQLFFVPLFAEGGTSYTDGTPPDDFLDLNIYRTLVIKFTIDGETIVNSRNVMNYFSQSEFVPVIPYRFGNLDSIIWTQSVGVYNGPLSPGHHVMKLDVRNTIPAFGAISEFHNTWNITVLPKNK
jgi:hypothetical protein